MDEINNEIIKALEGKVEIQAKMIKELKARIVNIENSYTKINEENACRINYLRNELLKKNII